MIKYRDNTGQIVEVEGDLHITDDIHGDPVCLGDEISYTFEGIKGVRSYVVWENFQVSARDFAGVVSFRVCTHIELVKK